MVILYCSQSKARAVSVSANSDERYSSKTGYLSQITKKAEMNGAKSPSETNTMGAVRNHLVSSFLFLVERG